MLKTDSIQAPALQPDTSALDSLKDEKKLIRFLFCYLCLKAFNIIRICSFFLYMMSVFSGNLKNKPHLLDLNMTVFLNYLNLYE